MNPVLRIKETTKRSLRELRLYWKHYVFQSIAAAVTIFAVFLILPYEVMVASIGATTFVVFAMPKNITAQPRNVIGGHLVGLVCGTLCSLIPHQLFVLSIIIYSCAVGLSIFVMVITDTEHPPASGTALGTAIMGYSIKTIITVIVSAIILSVVHRLFRSYLRDLT